VASRPGVTSPILGVRTEDQLDYIIAAIDVKFTPVDIAALNAITKPTLNFPSGFLGGALPASYPGMVVDGRSFAAHSRSEEMASR
jgi:hypothetical protein